MLCIAPRRTVCSTVICPAHGVIAFCAYAGVKEIGVAAELGLVEIDS